METRAVLAAIEDAGRPLPLDALVAILQAGRGEVSDVLQLAQDLGFVVVRADRPGGDRPPAVAWDLTDSGREELALY
jgi:DNA-binding PadR family transcriptional regulator